MEALKRAARLYLQLSQRAQPVNNTLGKTSDQMFRACVYLFVEYWQDGETLENFVPCLTSRNSVMLVCTLRLHSGLVHRAAGLIKDLEARGLLDDTLVLWTTEFGRMPCSQGSRGRDHNPFGFTNWLAGGGIKGGVSYGATDEWSYQAVENRAYCYDVHATILHLLGIDHTKLVFRHNGADRRRTDVHGEVIEPLLA